MSNKELAELLKHCSPNILYVVNGKNKIIKLETPFTVIVKNNIGELAEGQIVEVDKLYITQQGKIVFLVQDKYYHTIHFDILAI